MGGGEVESRSALAPKPGKPEVMGQGQEGGARRVEDFSDVWGEDEGVDADLEREARDQAIEEERLWNLDPDEWPKSAARVADCPCGAVR